MTKMAILPMLTIYEKLESNRCLSKKITLEICEDVPDGVLTLSDGSSWYHDVDVCVF